MTNPATAPPSRALTILEEDELLFRDSVLEFARGEIAPFVREMDEQATFPRSLVDKLFDLGVMGIEVPRLRRLGNVLPRGARGRSALAASIPRWGFSSTSRTHWW